MSPQSLILLREPVARRVLAERALILRVLTPAYPCAGVGELRVLRLREAVGPDGGRQTEIVAGYERYERLPA